MKEIVGISIIYSPYLEKDAMVTFLGEDKIYSILAKGVEKLSSKNRVLVTKYNLSRLTLTTSKDGYVLRNGKLIESYPNINNSLLSLLVLDFMSEITFKMIDNNDGYKVSEYFFKSLKLLNNDFDSLTILNFYFAKVLDASGYSLNISYCQRCHQKEAINSLSYSDGGFICKNCFDPLNDLKLKPDILKIIRYIFMCDLTNYGKVEFETSLNKEVLRILEQFLNYIDGTKIKSLNEIKNIIK